MLPVANRLIIRLFVTVMLILIGLKVFDGISKDVIVKFNCVSSDQYLDLVASNHLL